MLDIDGLDLASAMENSTDYKIIRDGGWLYVFPADADFDILASQRGMLAWDHNAALIVDDAGCVTNSRFGAASGNPQWR